jgi:hypothetical protein
MIQLVLPTNRMGLWRGCFAHMLGLKPLHLYDLQIFTWPLFSSASCGRHTDTKKPENMEFSFQSFVCSRRCDEKSL